MADKGSKKQLLRNNEYYDLQNKLDDLYSKSRKNYKFNNLMDLISNENNIKDNKAKNKRTDKKYSKTYCS